MKRTFLLLVLVFSTLLLSVRSGSASVQNYRAHLAGRNEVPAVDTNAQGQAIFKMRGAGEGLEYKLIVANIYDVRMTHIHVAPPGVNGGVIAWLYPSGPPPVLIPGRTDGILAEGVIYDHNIMFDYNEDGTKDLYDLIEAIEAGETYVNVHTVANPGGEIRGQIH